MLLINLYVNNTVDLEKGVHVMTTFVMGLNTIRYGGV